MAVFKSLLLLFLLVPLLEIYLLLQAGERLGVMPTVGLVILTAVLGAALLRIQGLQTLASVQARLHRGQLPAVDLLGGLLLLICGALLLTPGFFTDGIGFMLLIPSLRRQAALGLLRYAASRHKRSQAKAGVVIEGEYAEVDEGRKLP